MELFDRKLTQEDDCVARAVHFRLEAALVAFFCSVKLKTIQ